VGKRVRRVVQQPAARRTAEPRTVHEHVGSEGDYRGAPPGVQSATTPQCFGLSDAGGVRRPMPILGGSAPKPPASIPNRRAPGEEAGRGSKTWSDSHSDWYINRGQVSRGSKTWSDSHSDWYINRGQVR
jgi:hypothetical protein